MYCAKIGKPGQIEREAQTGRRVYESNRRCPTVMPIVDLVIIDEERAAMITPFYPMALSYVENLPDVSIVNTAIFGLATIKAFSAAGMCNGDIKPSNMMLSSVGNTVVTIDFGSAVELGGSIVATTPMLGLDCSTTGSVRYDLTCLASSIAYLGGEDLLHVNSRSQLAELLRSDSLDRLSYRIAILCLEPDDIDQIWSDALELITGRELNE
jgi:serine/threonine protein kinase